MSSFSPFIHQFSELQTSQDDDIETYYHRYTLLAKPYPPPNDQSKNAYKISLAQILNYLIDFGIGYNSVCITTLTNEQQFSTGMYVNRHETNSSKRPATVADLKTIVEKIVRSMVYHTVYHNGTTDGVKKTNNIYPTYLFTLDENITSEKLKELTGIDYVEVADFKDFPCTEGRDYLMPKYTDGYIPVDDMLICPKHGHKSNDSLQNSWKYHWYVKISSNKKLIIWAGHATKLGNMLLYKTKSPDVTLNTINCGTKNDELKWTNNASAEYKCEPSWEYPESVLCHKNNPVYPANTKDGNVSIRWPGRRYRLFKQVGI